MKNITISEECVGCEACVEVCPDVFEMDETTGQVRVKTPNSVDACVAEAIEICPVNAISQE